MKTIYDKEGIEVAIVLRSVDYVQQNDKHFFSEVEDTLQIGSLFFKKDSGVEAHVHQTKDIPNNPMEVLLVLSGWAWADIYADDHVFMDSVELKTGDILIQKRGGHGFRFVSDTNLLEIKTGPYYGKESDKEMR